MIRTLALVLLLGGCVTVDANDSWSIDGRTVSVGMEREVVVDIWGEPAECENTPSLMVPDSLCRYGEVLVYYRDDRVYQILGDV